MHNAKGENEFVKEQGRQHLLRCSKVYLGDPYLKNTRVVKVLQSLVSNFDVQMDDVNSCRNSTISNSPAPDPILGIRIQGEETKENDGTEHNSFVVKALTESNRYHISETSSPNGNNSSTFTVTTGHIHDSQSSVKSSSSNNYRETTPTIPNPFVAAPYLGGTRPEDMFYSSLSMGFGNSMFKQQQQQQQQQTEVLPNMMQQQQQQQQQDQSMNMDFENSSGSETVDPILCPNLAGVQQCPSLQEGQCSLPFSSQQQHQRYPTASSTSTTNTSPETNYSTSCQQQQQQQPQPQPQHCSNTFLDIYNMEPISQPQPTQFDLTSLSSQVPLWDVPSGVTWNEWESFLKTNVDNTNTST